MFLNVKIQDQSFKLSVGSGLNDWTWLSHFAARKFSKSHYPQGTYLPSQLYIIDKQNQKLYPHPREKINHFLDQNKCNPNNITTVIKVRKGNHALSQSQKIWQSEAFGMQRMMMNVAYILDTEKYRNKEGQKEFFFKVLFHYNMHNDIKHFFTDKKYSSPIQLELEEIKLDKKQTNFKGQLKIPYGDVVPELFYFWRDPKDPTSYRSQKIKDVELKPDLFKVHIYITPKYVSINQLNDQVAEEMKFSDNITKTLQQKQLQAKKRNANSSLCCYTFENFWKLLEQQHGDELNLELYDKSTKQRLKIIIQKSLNSLYEIFFYYFIVQNQNKEKKEELGITYQHVMHFLRFYQVFDNLDSLYRFLQYYNFDFKFKNIKDTVDIENKSVKFIQFVAILLRALQFVQTQTQQVQEQTFDTATASQLDSIIRIDSEQEEFSNLKRNIRENPKIISFMRNNSQQLKQIFVNQIVRSTQKAGDKYVMMKEQFKALLSLSGFTQQNNDFVVQDLFQQLEFQEEGIFYYQFLEAIQWLALAVVSSDKQSTVINEQQQALVVIEKIKFFIEAVKL